VTRQRYLYTGSRPALLLVGCILIAGLAYLFWYGALHPISSRKISPGLFSLICWMGLASFLYIGFSAVRYWFHSRRDPKFVELDDDEASLPRFSDSAGFLRVPYTHILRVGEQEIPNEGITLVVLTTMGESRLRPSDFATSSLYSQFKRLLISRWQAAAAANPTAPQRPVAPVEQRAPQIHSAADSAVLRAIQVGKTSDPIIGAKFAGKEIFLRLTNALAKNDPRGVHAETLFCALGALAGYACQAGLRAQAVVAGRPVNSAFTVVKTTDGKEFYFGEAIHRSLVEDKLSVWSLAAGAAQHAGAKSLPDINEIIKHTAKSAGSEAFGIVRYPGAGATKEPPIAWVRSLWPVLLPPLRELTGDPALWSVACGLAIQQAMGQPNNQLAPEASLTIVMEAAVPMSKVKL